jgi:dihydroorotase/N-acyl-D-amino-acid deacylase
MLERLKNPGDRQRIRDEIGRQTGDWDNEWQAITGPHDILITAVDNPDLRALQGKRIDEIAQLWHEGPIDTIFDLLLKDGGQTTNAVFGMSEPDVVLALRQPWVSIDNDYSATSPEGILGRDHPHPRAYGTFPRILKQYVREQHVLSLPDAIRKFSALPAQRERLADRGVLKQGMCADIVIFDPDTVADKATYDSPNQLSVGMQWVLVNGVPVIAQGRMTGALPGKVLRGAGYRPG